MRVCRILLLSRYISYCPYIQLTNSWQDNTWAFVQCEPDIWIAVSVSNRYDIEGQHIPLQTPNPAGLQSAIKVNSCYINLMHLLLTSSPLWQTMYQYLLLYVLHRPLRGYLEEGWEQIANVMALRKKVRKLRMRSCQEEQDIHVIMAVAIRCII